MRKFLLIGLSLIVTSFLVAQTTTRLEIKSLPLFHTAEKFYAAGSFNGWNPADAKFELKRNDKGEYVLELNLPEGKYEYKITRGNWDKAECKEKGDNIPNRTLEIPSAATIQISIEQWQDRVPKKPKLSTASKNVRIIETAFQIPQLNRNRRIWI